MAVFTGALVASGHWLLTIFGIGLVSAVSRISVTAPVSEDFRLIAIYSFAIASIGSAAILLPATRRFSDALYKRQPEKAPALLFACFAVAGLAAAALALVVFGIVLDQPIAIILTGVTFSTLVAMIWTASTFCSAIFAVRAVLAAYFTGTLIGLVAAVIAGIQTGIAWVMAMAYAAGLAVSLGALIPVFLSSFPFPIRSATSAIRGVLRSLSKFAYLSFGAFMGALAIWASTLVVWLSAFGETNASGFRAAELYDTPHFFGLLALVPGFALLIVFFETTLFRGLRRHHDLIEQHGSLKQLQASAARLTSLVARSAVTLVAAQILTAIAFVAAAPLAAEANILQSSQVSVMQITAMGSVMHLIVILSSVVLIYLDARRLFCLVQGAFLLATVAASAGLLEFGERWFGVGYLVGASVGAIVAAIATQSVLARLNEHIFMIAAGRLQSILGSRRS
ncbi:exopolysaccharide Pel transporter PelG [Jannaschia ovalis]|uniref:Exopolysaccharide Pel transporter PelG n=1 Tax=Jannaschia ovalis TaxID=3038773 RepID=A0ABY8LEJ8_9RHOB|nr:exopolysaccharide Pel transporter PelG [Jannaschia sp. GRR-S6-38]WGH78735.1 exopolysaccharide Pel transporter PelG [Jannaschia sp. GRR-S6-38]